MNKPVDVKDLQAPLGDLQMYINGEWVESESGKRNDIFSPGSGQKIGTVPTGTREDARRAIAAAATKEDELRFMSPAERAAMCKRIADALDRNKDELARAIALDQGKPYHSEGIWEAGVAPHFFREAAEEIVRLYGETIPSGDRNKRYVTFWQSRGPYACITPWNFPYNMPAEHVSANLAAGNPVIWVPAPSTSGCAVTFAKVLEEADLPKGAFNMVIGEGGVVGDEIVANPGTRGIGFTGSPVTGQKIAERGAGKPMLLELGGNGPFIVLADANLDAAAEGIAFSAYLNAGQACSATERVLVAASIKDELLEKVLAITSKIVLGDPFDPKTTMGPLNNEQVAAKMDRHIADAIAKGAKVLAGGGRAKGMPTNLYYQPTILDGVTSDMQVNREESFGPIVPVITFNTNEEALALANDNESGLICSVYTKNLKAAYWFGERIRCGVVNINETSDYWETPVPYGGVAGKKSGMGRLGGTHTLRSVMDQRAILFDFEKGGF